MKFTTRYKAELFLLLAAVLWGGTFVVTKVGLDLVSPLLFLGVRFSLAFLIFLVLQIRRLKLLTRRILIHGIFLGILLFSGFALQITGLQHTTASKSGFITYLYALIVPPLQFLLLKKRLKPGNIIGLIIVLGGFTMFNLPEDSSLNFGDFLTLAGAISFGFHLVNLNKYAEKSDPKLLTLLQFGVISVLSLVSAFLFEEIRFAVNLNLVISWLYLSIFATVICIYLMTNYQRFISPTKAVIIYSMEPVFAVLFAVISGVDKILPMEILGCLLILGGVLFSELWDLRKRSS